MTECSHPGCSQASRAKGLCENHYRRALRRARGVGGVESQDGRVFKVRVRTVNGSQPFYYSDPDKAATRAAQARAEGALLYFGEYSFERRLS